MALSGNELFQLKILRNLKDQPTDEYGIADELHIENSSEVFDAIMTMVDLGWLRDQPNRFAKDLDSTDEVEWWVTEQGERRLADLSART